MRALLFRIALFSLIAIIGISCKKQSTTPNNTDPGYFVKIKKDGIWINFSGIYTAGELGADGFDPANIDLTAVGNTPDGTLHFDLTVQLVSTTFPTGTYHSSYIVDHPWVSITYIFQPDIVTTPEVYEIQPADGMAPSAYTVNITEITPTTLRGNFTGNYLASDTPNTTAITEGEFFVKRIR